MSGDGRGQHHERFDGTGYPHQLKGHEISLAARIVAVADAYEVMTAPRPYKRTMSVSAARKELVRVAGTQLDPVIVRAFLNVSVGRLWRTIGFGAWIAQVPQLGRVFSFGGFAGSGMGMGIATATTATVLAVTGGRRAGSRSGARRARPGGGGGRRPASDATAQPPLVTTGPPAVTDPTTSALLRRTDGHPEAEPGHSQHPNRRTQAARPALRRRSPSPTPTPKPTATPTPKPTASPRRPADPWSCAQCTNTSATCTSYCSGSSNIIVHHLLQGNNNTTCTSHCFGDEQQVRAPHTAREATTRSVSRSARPQPSWRR